MPLYEYECTKCKKHFEKIQKFSDAPLVKCEACGGRLEQVISSPAVQFKGSGWYITDYARKGASDKPAAEGSSNKTGDGAKSSPSSETKESTEPSPAEAKK